MNANGQHATAVGLDAPPGAASVLLEVRDLVQEFVVRNHGDVKGGVLQAVSGVSFEVRENETVGLVGETGSGKSTLARSILQQPPPKSGSVRLGSVELTRLTRRERYRIGSSVQMVFQDPISSLDPHWEVAQIVEEPLSCFGVGSRRTRRARVDELLDLVGLDPVSYRSRRPRELSGGQCQRVAIARAIALNPKLIICDEAVSSLDVVIQAQILNVLERLRTEMQLSYLFIAHDLAMVKQVSDRVMVMYLGRVCEIGSADDLYAAPRHPYTFALLASVPNPDPGIEPGEPDEFISGELPSPLDPPSGCRFRTRCPRAEARCAAEVPALRRVGDDHFVACHYPMAGAE